MIHRDFSEVPKPYEIPTEDAVGMLPLVPRYSRDHRERLRTRFMKGGATSMPDYELLEMVLFRAIPKRDIRPIAQALFDEFGDFNKIISASPLRLGAIEGVGPAVICELKLVEAAAHRLAQSRVINRRVLSSSSELLDYCRVSMSHLNCEQFRVLFLDRKNVLIADEAQAQGTVDHVPVYPREVVKRALELSASALILAHNHPSGDPTPSDADIALTELICRAAQTLGITVHDHLIVGRTEHFSFRSEGLF